MIKLMFVCHGNICRSPMAEFIMKNIVKNNNNENQFIISSSATSTEEIFRGVGNPIYPPAQRILIKHNIPFDLNKRAVQFTNADYINYDIIVVMDDNNLRNINRIIGSDSNKKIFKLMSFAGANKDVADPWYSGDFDEAYNDINSGCKSLYNYFKNSGEIH